jgi:hypothetical protein
MTIRDNMNKLIGAAKVIGASRAKTSPQTSKMQFPTGEKMIYGMVFKFSKISYDLEPGSKAKFSNLTNDSHIFLPLPVGGIVENLGINYQQQDIGAVSQLMEAGAQGAQMLVDNVTGNPAPGQNVQSIINQAETVTGAAALALRKLANEAVPGAGALIDIKTGSVVNPYSLSLFQSVAPRAHQLVFRLVPRSQSDSAMIRKIVQQFQYHSLPSRKGKFFLTMPDELEISFFGTDKLFKFAPCVINNVTVNYTPFGTPSFFGADNAPTGVELTLNLQEIEALTRESYEAKA